MVHLSEKRLNEIFTGCNNKHIAVIGDLMLDRYIWGNVSRISPEAPVPVIDMEKEQSRLGGAANVAQNIKSLGGKPLLFGVIGEDNSGKQLLKLIKESKFSKKGIIVDETRPTTVKTRVIAHNQHVVRIDRESKKDISETTSKKIIEILKRNIKSIDGIILEDYNKGVIVKSLIKQIIEIANENRKVITVDPKFNNFFEYQNVTIFKPNRKEVEEVMGVRLTDKQKITNVGKELLYKLKAKNILLTLGEQGMMLFEDNGNISQVQTKAQKVADVSGAGDTVISTITLTLVGGATIKEAATISNFAGGIVCGYVGIVPINKDELKRTIIKDMKNSKI